MNEQHVSPFADLAFHKAMLDALAANIALLDRKGTILFVNASWRIFGEENGICDPRYGVGANYFDACRAAVDPNARAAAQGIQDVLGGRRSFFQLEYPCHSPDQQRWFVLRATPIEGYPGMAVVAHENITERVIAESRLERNDSTGNINLVAQGFPQWRERIETLVDEHREFRTICSDYQELATWIEEHRTADANRNELQNARELLDSLTEEIRLVIDTVDANGE